jgi:long-subunit fatty acid transport protein
MTRIYENGVVDKKQSPNGEYNYRISTPMKLITSATITLANMILISGDLEYINYSSGKLKANDYAFFDENAEIRDKYKPTLNIRAGAELLLQPISFRVGFGRYGNPYQDNINEGNYWVASGGLGYRNSDFFVDLGVSYTMRQEDYYMYNPAIIEAADLTYNNYRIAITTGVKF